MNGVREEAFFLGAGTGRSGERLFGVLHRPSRHARRGAGWLICSPFGTERTCSHRAMFEIARALAREGFDVLRFDYRGCGESSGSPEEFTFEDHAKDAAVAAAELERRAGVPCRGMLGLRLGAAVAARAAGATGREPLLVMWEPVADGARYCGELLRTAMANELVDSGAAPRTRAEMEDALSRNESVVVNGHPLTRGMFTSLATVDLAEGGRPTASPVLIMQIDAGRARPPREPLKRLRDAYARGGETDLQVIRAPPVWLRVKRYDWRPAELFGATLEWVRDRRGPLRRPLLGPGAREGERPRPAERAGARGRSPSGAAREGPGAGADERPVEFHVLGERVAGMAHVPREAAAGAPGVVMLAAGESCRTSLFYVPLARTLARAGWSVLRFDPRGIGDSDGDLGCATLAEVFRKIQGGGLVPDCLAAVDFMERRDNGRPRGGAGPARRGDRPARAQARVHAAPALPVQGDDSAVPFVGADRLVLATDVLPPERAQGPALDARGAQEDEGPRRIPRAYRAARAPRGRDGLGRVVRQEAGPERERLDAPCAQTFPRPRRARALRLRRHRRAAHVRAGGARSRSWPLGLGRAPGAACHRWGRP
ncbi:MAG: alpha/beta fold hydrolase [Planctomycetota bacterium]